MKKLFLLFFSVVSLLIYNSCETEKPWQPLFNGENIDNWDKFIGTPLKGFDSLAQTATIDKVFSIVEEKGAKIIRISGEVNGSLATRDTFSNFHLQLVFKWGNDVYTSRNSGLLHHGFGDFGAALGTWMTNIECQLKHGSLGDTYLMNNTYCEATVKEMENGLTFSNKGVVRKFGNDFSGRSIKKSQDAENPLGQWNTVDLYCLGRTTVHVVNSKTVMVNTNTGIVENGRVIPLSSGKIQLQSEGGELFIKTVRIKSIKKIPEEVLKDAI